MKIHGYHLPPSTGPLQILQEALLQYKQTTRANQRLHNLLTRLQRPLTLLRERKSHLIPLLDSHFPRPAGKHRLYLRLIHHLLRVISQDTHSHIYLIYHLLHLHAKVLHYRLPGGQSPIVMSRLPRARGASSTTRSLAKAYNRALGHLLGTTLSPPHPVLI